MMKLNFAAALLAALVWAGGCGEKDRGGPYLQPGGTSLPPPAQTLGGLVEQLGHEHFKVRVGAAFGLGKLRDPAAVQALAKALGDDRKEVRVEAAVALGKIGDPSAVDALAGALGDAKAEVRAAAAAALARIGGEPATATLLRALRKEDTRLCAVRALGDLGEARAVDALVGMLGNPDLWVRADAAQALGMIGRPEALESLVKALREDPSIRSEAAIALGELADVRAEEALLPFAGDEDAETREAVARALARIAGPKSLDVLRKLGSDPEHGIRVWAGLGLWKLAADEGGKRVVLEAAGHEIPDVRAQSALALGDLGDDKALAILKSLIEDRDVVTRENAVAALQRRGGAQARVLLLDALRDRETCVRARAARALRKLTGRDFGENRAKWKAWLEEQGEKK
jgi:HEAT repeat protein